MPFNAQVLTAMIAGPSDVALCVKAVEAAVHKWNRHHAERRKAVLLPKHWLTSVAPEQGGRPQGIVNEQMGMSDVLVAVFRARLGSPTGVAASGTVEEIDRHVAAGKVVMIYVLQIQSDLGSLDLDQLSRLKIAVAGWKQRGIVRDDVRETDLEQLVLDDLTLKGDRRNWGQVESRLNANVKPAEPVMSMWAEKLLLGAAASANGTIVAGFNGGSGGLYTDGKLLASYGDARTRAELQAALNELGSGGYVSGSRDVYSVTSAGYKWFDAYRNKIVDAMNT